MSPREHRFSDAAACATALASYLAELAKNAIARHGEAALIVSGGTTPLVLFERLRTLDIEWPRVKMSLADERWVGIDDSASNEGLVRKHLLQGPAAAAQFIGLKNAAPSASAGAALAWSGLEVLRRPFEAVLLGMGDDGHTASLFPNCSALRAALDLHSDPCCVAMQAPVTPPERLSLNLAALTETRSIIVLISGEDKWRVYERARDDQDVLAMPIRAVLHQDQIPVDVYWSR